MSLLRFRDRLKSRHEQVSVCTSNSLGSLSRWLKGRRVVIDEVEGDDVAGGSKGL